MIEYRTFTSESVSEGHPDKMADQISDAIVDHLLEKDRDARIAVEALVKTGMVVLAGEVRLGSGAKVALQEYESIVRKTINDIGYTEQALEFDGQSCAVMNYIGAQSEEIAEGVDGADELGAGDQGMMFGYACDETDVFMPAPITYAHRLMLRQAKLRKSGALPWLRPDAKSQVTLNYDDKGKPVSVAAVVLSTQHDPGISLAELKKQVREQIIDPVIAAASLSPPPPECVHINPTGSFVIGGPVGDCGLTGRKIIVDTYGGAARHGGGAFSGKDPSKVDRSAAYACRYVAKNIVAAGLASHCEIQVSYAIGVSEPVSIAVNTFGSARDGITDAEIIRRVKRDFDFRPKHLIEKLKLKETRYLPVAAYGHFGRPNHHDDNHELQDLPWERTDLMHQLKHS